jgi:serine/threonine protein phosphatase PrpC
LKTRSVIVAGNPEIQDRVEIFSDANRVIVALADGAGGMSGGAQAAELFVSIVRENMSSLHTAADCDRVLRSADDRISATGGETTGIVLIAHGGRVFGASVGDSEAWLFSSTGEVHLTQSQRRKPMLGSGEADPGAFTTEVREGLLLVASDGLWKYTSNEKIRGEIRAGAGDDLLDRLVKLVRLRSGALQDDVALAALELG